MRTGDFACGTPIACRQVGFLLQYDWWMAQVEAARRLLEESETPSQRVASRCGFASPDTMRRAFMRRIGTGPSDYRERFRR
jgi:methylphosphotriester-DNA--protein-cysteine methyltransferase